MRKQFAALLHDLMKEDEKIFLLTGDLGYGLFNEIRETFPNRAINVGSCEQLLIGMAIGLHYKGYIPICYSITPFLLYRPFELIRNYVNYEQLPLKLFGGGRNKDYSHDGFTHWCEDDEQILSCLNNIKIYKPGDLENEYFKNIIYSPHPSYVNLIR